MSESVNPTVREAQPADLKKIQDLSAKLFEHDKAWISHLKMDWPHKEGEQYFADGIAGKDAVCLVTEVGGQIVGYLQGGLKNSEDYRDVKMTELENMYVEDEFRKQGVGKLLVKAFIEWSKEQGAQRTLVIASVPNTNAIKFYEAAGFEPYSLELEMDLER